MSFTVHCNNFHFFWIVSLLIFVFLSDCFYFYTDFYELTTKEHCIAVTQLLSRLYWGSGSFIISYHSVLCMLTPLMTAILGEVFTELAVGLLQAFTECQFRTQQNSINNFQHADKNPNGCLLVPGTYKSRQIGLMNDWVLAWIFGVFLIQIRRSAWSGSQSVWNLVRVFLEASKEFRFLSIQPRLVLRDA